LIISALSNKESHLWYLAPFRSQAKEIAWNMLKELSPKDTIRRANESELYIEYINGSRISVKGADNEESLVGVYLGSKHCPGSLGIVIDEVALIRDNRKVWERIIQPMLLDCQSSVLMIGTPRGKDFFWEQWLIGQRKEKGYESWHFTSYDNPLIPDAEIDAKKETMNEREFLQEHMASFVDYVGLIYPEFNTKHIIEPRYFPKQYQRIGAIDPALSGTTAVIKAYIDEDARLTIYDEYYEQDKRASEVAEAIREDGITWYIDPASKIRSQQAEGKLYSLYDEYAGHGINALVGENDVGAGINRVGEMFKADNIKIFSTCTNLIWELERFHWAEQRTGIGGEPTAKPFKKDDHAVDALRYLVMSRFDKSELKISVTADYWSPWAVMERNKKAKEKHFKYQARR